MVSPEQKTTPAEWVQILVSNAEALRKSGVLSFSVDGCEVILAPHTTEFSSEANEEDFEDDDPLDDPSTFGNRTGDAPGYNRDKR